VVSVREHFYLEVLRYGRDLLPRLFPS
jgi:hypothetical protein